MIDGERLWKSADPSWAKPVRASFKDWNFDFSEFVTVNEKAFGRVLADYIEESLAEHPPMLQFWGRVEKHYTPDTLYLMLPFPDQDNWCWWKFTISDILDYLLRKDCASDGAQDAFRALAAKFREFAEKIDAKIVRLDSGEDP